MVNKRNILSITVGIVALVVLGWLAKAAMTTSFIGGTTAEIAKCKKNLHYNPVRCRQLLSIRQAPKKRSSTFDPVGASSPGGLQLGQ